MEKENKKVNDGANLEPTGTQSKFQTFDEILSNKEYQAEFDRRVQKAIKTAQRKWQEINDEEKTVHERLKENTSIIKTVNIVIY